MSQIVAMAKRLQEAEQAVLDLKRALDAKPSIASSDLADDFTPTVTRRGSEQSSVGDLKSVRRESFVRAQGRSPSKEPTSEELLSDLSLDEHGKVLFISKSLNDHETDNLRSHIMGLHRLSTTPLLWRLRRQRSRHTTSRPRNST